MGVRLIRPAVAKTLFEQALHDAEPHRGTSQNLRKPTYALPELSVGLLERTPLFASPDGACFLSLGGSPCAIYRVGELDLVAVSYEGDALRLWPIRIVRKEIGRSLRRELHCIASGRSWKQLYFHQGGFFSKAALGLQSAGKQSAEQRQYAENQRLADRVLGLDGMEPARGKKRQAAMHALSGVALSEDRREAIERVQFDSQRRRSLSQPRSPRPRNGAMSVMAGVRGFAPAVFTPLEQNILFLKHRSAGEHPVFAEPETPAFIEDHPCIDLRSLYELTPADGERVIGLRWNVPAIRHINCAIAVRRGGKLPAPLHVQISFIDQRKPVFQVIQVVEAPLARGQRLRMMCPVNGTQHDQLYIRNAYLASAKAHRLVNRSQRSSRTGQPA